MTRSWASLGFADSTSNHSGRSLSTPGILTISELGYQKLELKHIAQ